MKSNKPQPKKPVVTAKAAKKAALAKPKSKWKRILFQLATWAITFGLLYYIFFVKLAGEVSFSEVWATVSALSLLQLIVLLLAGLLTIVAVGWTAATVLPGLSVIKGTEASVVGQLTSVALPPPLDMVIRFTMYKTYGFSNDKSVIAVAIAGIARYFTVVAIPMIGLALVLVTGQGNWGYALWLASLSIVFGFAFWLMRKILASELFAAKTGHALEKSANHALKLVRRDPSDQLADRIIKFGSDTRTVIFKHFWPISISNIAWGLSCALVFFLSVRFCGIGADVFSAPYLVLVTGVMLLLSSIPITPGGIGISEAVLMSVIQFPNEEVQTAFVSALFLYRVFTWLLPMPVGMVSYFWWRYETSRQKLVQNLV